MHSAPRAALALALESRSVAPITLAFGPSISILYTVSRVLLHLEGGAGENASVSSCSQTGSREWTLLKAG